MPDHVDRRAARVLLLDAEDRVLLFLGCDPADRGAGTWWFTPGGGIDEGETPAEAGAREVFEETGLRLTAADLTGPVHSELAHFSLNGTSYRQTGEFFVARVDAHDVDTQGFSTLEQEFVLDHRWWSRADLRHTEEVVYPACLVELLDRVA